MVCVYACINKPDLHFFLYTSFSQFIDIAGLWLLKTHTINEWKSCCWAWVAEWKPPRYDFLARDDQCMWSHDFSQFTYSPLFVLLIVFWRARGEAAAVKMYVYISRHSKTTNNSVNGGPIFIAPLLFLTAGRTCAHKYWVILSITRCVRLTLNTSFLLSFLYTTSTQSFKYDKND